MPILTDYHLHTPLCRHATGPLEAYVERAIALGLEHVGFADHNPLPGGRGADVRMPEEALDGYVERVIDLRRAYRGQIDVKLGLELDYVAELDDYLARQVAAYPWDYIIGSIHYLDSACTLGAWSRRLALDADACYRRYFDLLRGMLGSGLCDVVAHFDVPKRSGRFPGHAVADDLRQTLAEMAGAGICLEINASGYRHEELPSPQPYPDWPIVEQALALKVPLVVNSDAHAPDQVGTRFAEIGDVLRDRGCRQLVKFERRQRTFYAL